MRTQTIARLLVLGASFLASLFLTGGSCQAQQAPAETQAVVPARPVGAINGRVLSSGGEPLAGATVYVSTLGSNPPRSTAADASGNFRVEGLDPTAYFVWAGAPGFVADNPLGSNERRHYYHIGDSVTLTLVRGAVITGTVTSSTNTPIVNATVRAFRVRDENGLPVQGVAQARERATDDRGFYRIYGLPSGSYVVSAGGAGRFTGFMGSQYESDAPTYAPSSTRDTAAEVVARSGEEATADIQYRGDAGHSVSGSLTGAITSPSIMFAGVTIYLTELRSRTVVMLANANPQTNYSFAFYGVGDGEYEVYAQRFTPSGESSISEPKQIKVQGADLAGISLNLLSLGSISGRLVLESVPKAECVKRRSTASQETVVRAGRTAETRTTRPPGKTQPVPTEVPLTFTSQAIESIPDAKGEFVMRNVQHGNYRLTTELPEGGWFLRAITNGTPPSAPKPSDPNIPRDGLSIKPGDKVSGLTVTITEGAASLSGLISIPQGQRAPAGLRVYLLPAERESAENVLRFFEASVDARAGFAISNIPPGRYWLVARAPDEGDPARVKPIRQESALRAKILREAEALKSEITFKPCEQTRDFELPWISTARP